MIAQELTIGKRYELSVDLNVGTNFAWNQWSNILYFRQRGTQGFMEEGDRLPAIYQWPSSNKLHLCNNVEGNVNYCYDHDNMPTNTWFNLKFRQVSGKLF